LFSEWVDKLFDNQNEMVDLLNMYEIKKHELCGGLKYDIIPKIGSWIKTTEWWNDNLNSINKNAKKLRVIEKELKS